MTIIWDMRHALGWPFIGPPVAVLIAFGEAGARFAPPAIEVAIWSFGAAAVLLTLKLLCWIAASHRSFERHNRLAAFVMLLAIAGGWYAADGWVHERQFDYIVSAQNAELKLSTAQLSASILAFVTERARHAPPAPRPETWNEDQAAFARHETEMVEAFEQPLRKVHAHRARCPPPAGPPGPGSRRLLRAPGETPFRCGSSA